MAQLKCLEILQMSKLPMVSSHPKTLFRCPLQVAAKFDSKIRLTIVTERKGRGHADSRFLWVSHTQFHKPQISFMVIFEISTVDYPSEIIMSLLTVLNMLPKTTKSQLSRKKLHQAPVAPVALKILLNNLSQTKRIWLRKELINFLKS